MKIALGLPGTAVLGVDGNIVAHVEQPAGTVQLILDVNGYFE